MYGQEWEEREANAKRRGGSSRMGGKNKRMGNAVNGNGTGLSL